MSKQIEISIVPKSQLKRDLDLSDEMKETLEDYILSLHGISEDSKEVYVSQVRTFGRFLMSREITKFEGTKAKDIYIFLSQYRKDTTKNNYITRLRHFYSKFLKLPKLVEHLKVSNNDLQPVTPSELLTPDEVVKLANEASKRRELYKIVILALFESCARISEVLSLRLGDAVFRGVVDKDGQRNLIATLHFKRSKGGVNKQPVVLTMFASELKRWVDNHPLKGDSLVWLFPSPYNLNKPLSLEAVSVALWNAGERLGIKKRTNPHWLRHSGLSYCANDLNYNEQLLMWRAGWKNTAMAKRYIHSGAELEGKAYLQRMSYVIEEEKPITIKPKTCPHCQALNPYTNTNCDFCAMPLDLEKYEKEIEKRRNLETLYQNLQKIYSGKISEEQNSELKHHTEVIRDLTELGRDDLATQYIEKLLETWVKVFLTA
ncbi:MAG: tyrosine-type recombinase/integrase [Candidatus Bathyarchaeota archaeon]|nr:tyrosine-type recombinase/integrase [Candidatus Bathyarchaeota archaeon]